MTHATVIEPMMFSLVNSGRTTPIQRTADIGGAFEMGEFAELTIDKTAGGIYTARLNINT